jgi:hypothetical protein
MAIAFPVREVLRHPQRFERGGFRIYVMGLLVVTTQEAYILDDQTDDKLHLQPSGQWREWLLQEIPPLEGPYLYLDEASVAGLARIEDDKVIWTWIWQVLLRGDGK